MKKIFAVIFCATALLWGGCSKDEAEGVLTSPEALVGKWQLIKVVECYKEDGKWYTEVEYDINKNIGDNELYYNIYNADGTTDETGQTWRYEDGKIILSDRADDPVEVRVLTASKLVVRDYFDYYGGEDYDEATYRRVN